MICLVAATVFTGPSLHSQTLDSLVASERAFATMSESDGMKAAFVANLAVDGVIFRPTPVNGREWFAEHPDVPGVLSWLPVYAGVSDAGDMGFTLGPWTYGAKPPDTSSTRRYGHYVTVWKRTPEGWRVAVDHGVTHARIPVTDASVRSWQPPETEPATADETLMQLDGQLLSPETLPTRSYSSRLSPGVWWLRDGMTPVRGADPAASHVATWLGHAEVSATGGGVARSRDLAFTYGVLRFTADGEAATPRAESYLRLWERGRDGWRILVEVTNPLPQQSGN